MVRFAEQEERTPATLPQWLQWQARQRGKELGLRHKRLGIWQAHSWSQLEGEVRQLAHVLWEHGFNPRSQLVILSRPRPEALLAALAAHWLGGVAVLLNPLDEPSTQQGLLHALPLEFSFAEGLEELERLRRSKSPFRLRLYAEARGVQAQAHELDYSALLRNGPFVQLEPQATPEHPAFIFYRQSTQGQIQQQPLSHRALLQQGQQLVTAEQLSPQEEALAARTLAAAGQAGYLLAPWLMAGFRLNVPERLATRDQDRRELGPTLVAGTRETYGRLYEQTQARLPPLGSLSRRFVDWALARPRSYLSQYLGEWLVRRPLRDVLGFSRTRVPLVLGDSLPSHIEAFFGDLGVFVRAWPDSSDWHSHSPPIQSSEVASDWTVTTPQPI